jgi:phosphoglycolate phosphatase
MAETLVLWDIDGTLLRSGPVAMHAFHRALREIYELQDDPARIEYGGKTDSQIVFEVLGLHDIQEDRVTERLDLFHQRYLEHFQDAYDELSGSVQVLPGVREVIAALASAGAVQSLLTGNLRSTAELKLRAAGLDTALDMSIGAYGSDHRNRDELVPIARAKMAERFGEAEHVVVIGDTPRDIACGKAGNARTVAVATGQWKLEVLAEYTPDVALLNLVDTEASVAAILGSR